MTLFHKGTYNPVPCLSMFFLRCNVAQIPGQVINREWEYGRKRGFRCVFERGVLSLYVNFKSLWYRK